jgi:branched-chain amino acid transport system permease protein
MMRGGAGTWWIAVVLLAALPWAPGLHSDFARSLLTQMGIAAVFALSYNLLLGQAGLLSFGHAVYFGLGGYASIHLMRAINAGLPIPVPFVPLAGAAAGLAFGILFGALTTRRGGTVFALISLGLGEWVHASSLMLPSFFGGEEGVTASRTRGPAMLGLHMGSQLEVYYVTACWLVVSALLMYGFLRTPVGRLANAVRDNPERVEFIGYDPRRIRFIVFCVSGLFAGLAGGLHAINYEIVASESLSAARSGAVLLMVFIGGVNHFLGAILGAVAITWLQVSLSDYTGAWMLYLGLLFMGIVAFVPGGLAGLAAVHLAAFRARALGAIARAYGAVLPFAALATNGAVTLVEMAYRRATQGEAGARMTLFGMALDTSTPWPWLGAALLLAVGAYGLRRMRPRLSEAWAAMGEPLHAAS